MKYKKTVRGIFIDRPNRFIANVKIDGKIETVHVKNTGRCRELLTKGVTVVLEKSDNPSRKTAYDLIGVYKKNFANSGMESYINMDSQAPNKVVREWLETKDFTYIKPEFVYGNSRLDFYCEKDKEKYYMEVKGVTLERNGVGYFPDAPTERGVKHIYELINAVKEGSNAALLFVVQMDGIDCVKPADDIQPEFGEALRKAKIAGVKIMALTCRMTEDEMNIVKETQL